MVLSSVDQVATDISFILYIYTYIYIYICLLVLTQLYRVLNTKIVVEEMNKVTGSKPWVNNKHLLR